jgi:tripartite ATP-independent transporter DctP family solute receptor
MNMRRLTLIVAVVFMVTLGLAWSAPAKMVIKLGHIAPPFHGAAKGFDAFAKYVQDKTNGRIIVKCFPFGRLGNERAMLQKTQAGTVQISAITTAVLSNTVPQVALFDLPFIYPDRKTAYAFLEDPKVQAYFFKYLKNKGLVGIGWSENEFRDINTRKPVYKPSDLKGMKMRVMVSPVYLDTFKALGASPVGIPFRDLYNALQRGTVDAQENPLLTSILIKATEVAKYVTLTKHILTETIVVVNQRFWNKLSAKDKAIFREAARLGFKINRQVNAQLHNKLPRLGISVWEYCKKNKVKVIRLTPAQRAAFVKAVAPVWAKYRKLFPKDFAFLMKRIKYWHKKVK